MRKPHCFTLILMLLLVTPLSSAQDVSPELQAQLNELEAYTSDTRELTLLEAVERRFPSREAAIADLRQITADTLPPEEAQRLSNFYIALGLLPAGSDYVALYLDTLEYQAAGYYDSATEIMNTLLIGGGELEDELPLLERITYVHEFTHALQDQHFDLDALDAQTRDNRDQNLALISLIEGDAMLMTNLYMERLMQENPLGVTLQLLAQGAQAGALSLPPDLPDIMAAELLGYYLNGAAFTSYLHNIGGWAQVNASYDALPQSSEQILHPEKYMSGEGPQPVEFIAPDLDPAWTLIWDTRLGEFYLQQILLREVERRDAFAAAAGWGGDHVQIYEHSETGQLAWFMRIAWDSLADASEFSSALAQYGQARFGSEVDALSGSRCWFNEIESLCLRDLSGDHLLAYAPTAALTEPYFEGYAE